jgi:SSS family solute:Na+ symporter/sodium/pantothenate symporter
LFRERYQDPRVGIVALVFILFFMSFMMVAQFKAGALVMKIAWPTSGALSLSEEATSYRLTEESLAELGQAGVSADVRLKLEPLLGETFESSGQLEGRLKELLSEAEFKDLKAPLIEQATPFDWLYLIGLVVFALTVVGYTLIGGFLAAVWTDLFQSVMMFVGVVLLLCLALPAAGGLESATRAAVENTSPDYAFGPGYAPDGRVFMPLGLALSFFFVWVFSGLGSPAGTVRIMACKDTTTIRRSIFLLGGYNYFIYLPLVVICICGRAIIPDLKHTDEIIPRMALMTTKDLAGGSLVAGLILTAPFGAVMATVSSYLVVIASGLVRDLYQRLLRPAATHTEIRRLTYISMFVIGAIAFVANIKPVAYLQAIVVFSGTAAAATFVFPLLMTAYWRRATAAGAIAGMLAGAGTHIGLYVAGWIMAAVYHPKTNDLAWLGYNPNIGPATRFNPYYLLEIDPIVWGLCASLLASMIVSLRTRPPDAAVVSRLFDAQPEEAPQTGDAPAPSEA